MKLISTICLYFTVQVFVLGQTFPEFSKLSGRGALVFSCAKAMGDYYYFQHGFLDAQEVVRVHHLDYNGNLLDSFNLRPDTTRRSGWICSVNDRLFFHGTKWRGNPFMNRHNYIEYDRNLHVIRETEGALFRPFVGIIAFVQTQSIVAEKVMDFTIYRDTVMAVYNFLVSDSPSTIVGRRNYFVKSSLDGRVYTSKQIPSTTTYNLFFANNKFYLQGSEAGFLNNKSLVEFDSEGNEIRSLDYDNYDSGGFLDGALGGWHNGRFYFSYVGNDPNVPGCPVKNAAIDVRDSTLKVLYRFKLPDCGYKVSGKMPFSFDAQDNVYYAAPHESFKKIMVYKFTPDFKPIWKKELDFSNEFSFYFPLSQLPTDDGGILLNCFEKLNAIQNLRIYKISSDGTVVSSTQLPGAMSAAEGPFAFPNPTTGPLTLTPEYAEMTTQAQLSTIDGRDVGFFTVQNGQIDLSAQPAGVYTLTLWDVRQRRVVGSQIVVKE